jgi:hypothetical protein
MTYRVKFPTYSRGLNSLHPLLRRYILDDHEKSLIKRDGVWAAVISPSLYDIEAAEGYYQGGRYILLTDTEAADLPAEFKELV